MEEKEEQRKQEETYCKVIEIHLNITLISISKDVQMYRWTKISNTTYQ